MSKIQILVCDDEKDIVRAVKIYLAGENYDVSEAFDGVQALEILHSRPIQLVLLDIMMPYMDGIQTLKKIREFSNVPVIFLSAKGEDVDKILGLNVGADDYITKPFNPLELMARVRSQLRRYMMLGGDKLKKQDGDTLSVGPICVDLDRKTVTVDGEPLNLTPTEYKIMVLFMKRPGRVYSPKEIYELVWKDNPYGAENTVAVHIRHLREKLEINPAEPRFLKVVWGRGYMLAGQERSL